ncbi:DUF4489 domain-containing protein [Clostridium paridis]|uniref:DUF4489 domain-containing protein n=1 Tax=Clostridium paridis TaxID=2803863 RepID=A0A937FFF0_9CLOT|nr:DUF4489 domain-containing protein [Clostridium paridis]MBL4932829.1 DUF4489 domain-containing protein [Clostridium paridis]
MNLICEGYDNRESNVVLNAATGGVGPFPVFTTPLIKNVPVVSVTIDTTTLRDPSVLLSFTAQINMPAELNVNLAFTIKRSNNQGVEQAIGGTYVFSSIAELLEAESFAFQFLDTINTKGIYTYSVQLAANSFIGIAPGLTITNATLSALAVG